MTYFVDALEGRKSVAYTLPENFQVYCTKCNGMMSPGTLVRRFDWGTFTHTTCPKTPLKTFAPHKYGITR